VTRLRFENGVALVRKSSRERPGVAVVDHGDIFEIVGLEHDPEPLGPSVVVPCPCCARGLAVSVYRDGVTIEAAGDDDGA
jgi:hypothetical protein